jgi:hypothetical protein
MTKRSRVGMAQAYLLFGCSMAQVSTKAPMSRFTGLAGVALLVATTLASVGAAGCTEGFIPNTDVPNTTENRKVILFCEQYRHAVEEKNVGELLKLASPGYHKRGIGTDDDVDFISLKDFLMNSFQQTDGIRYEIRYRKVTFEESTHVSVDYTFAASYRIPGVKKEEWRHAVADNRLDLVPDGDGYKIMSGM